MLPLSRDMCPLSLSKGSGKRERNEWGRDTENPGGVFEMMRAENGNTGNLGFFLKDGHGLIQEKAKYIGTVGTRWH